MRRGLLLTLLTLTTCAPPPPAPSPPVVASAAAVASSAPALASAAPSASSASSAAVVTEPSPDPDLDAAPLASDALLASLTPAESEQVALLGAVCTPTIGDAKGKREMGCYRCPSASEKVTDRRPRQKTADASMVQPYSSLRGSFSAAGADERALFFSTCSCWGCQDEVRLLRPGADGRFTPSVSSLVLGSHDCQVLRRAGQRDRAVCRLDFGRGYMAQRIFVYDLAQPSSPDTALTPDLEVVALDHLNLRCDVVGELFEQRSITRWRLHDIDHDGHDDLEVEMDVHDGAITAAMLRQCSAEQQGPIETYDDQGNVLTSRPRPVPVAPRPPSRHVRLQWLSTEARLAPTPATTRALAEMAAFHKKVYPDEAP